MASPRLILSPEQLLAAFPFHLAFNQDFQIVQAGAVLRRLCPDLTYGSPLEQFFEIKRPRLSSPGAVREHADSLFILEARNNGMLLKGQMLPDEGQGATIFLCTPWLKDLTAARMLGLSLNDFAIHDPVADFLFLLQATNTALADTNKLTTKLKLQREALRKAHSALEDQIKERSAALAVANREISERKRAEERIRHLAYHDAVTGLPNRTLFKDRLTVALAQARRSKQMLAVMFLDLDRFKSVNDTAGHPEGDKLLQALGAQLGGLMREGDTVARVGGDEFTVLLPAIEHPGRAVEVARRIVEAFRQPRLLGGHEFHVTASIGITVFPGDGDDAETLLRNADIAMYHAKESGRDNWQRYSAALGVSVVDRMVLEDDLRHGLERDQFVVHYQPQVDIATGQIAGVEALVRWHHPSRGLVMPLEFIPVAEETGLILPLGDWVLRTACAQTKAWQDAKLPPVRVGVNLSGRQFQQRDLAEWVRRVLRETGLHPQWLQLEITEGIAIQDVDYTIAVLHRLKEMGVQIAIDDFGTGHSGLSYLRRLPIDVVKIDQSFIHDLANPKDAQITSTVISMAHSLGLGVVAEGVETEDQLAFLRDRSCDEMQGFLYKKPVPADEMTDVLAQSRHAEAA